MQTLLCRWDDKGCSRQDAGSAHITITRDSDLVSNEQHIWPYWLWGIQQWWYIDIWIFLSDSSRFALCRIEKNQFFNSFMPDQGAVRPNSFFEHVFLWSFWLPELSVYYWQSITVQIWLVDSEFFSNSETDPWLTGDNRILICVWIQIDLSFVRSYQILLRSHPESFCSVAELVTEYSVCNLSTNY